MRAGRAWRSARAAAAAETVRVMVIGRIIVAELGVGGVLREAEKVAAA